MKPCGWLATLIALLAPLHFSCAADIRSCGNIRGFKPAPYLAVAIDLQTSTREDAIAQLKRWRFPNNTTNK